MSSSRRSYRTWCETILNGQLNSVNCYKWIVFNQVGGQRERETGKNGNCAGRSTIRYPSPPKKLRALLLLGFLLLLFLLRLGGVALSEGNGAENEAKTDGRCEELFH